MVVTVSAAMIDPGLTARLADVENIVALRYRGR